MSKELASIESGKPVQLNEVLTQQADHYDCLSCRLMG